ncbi:MAG: hypothetical protein ABI855_06285 [Bacteroidota bacterium]
MEHLKHHLQQLLMLKSILALVFTPSNDEARNSIAPFATDCDLLKDMAADLDKEIAEYRKLIKAIAIAKRKARKELADAGYPIMSSCRSYCNKSGMGETAEQMNITLPGLRSMPFDKILSKSLLAIGLVQPLLTPLLPYKVTPELFNNWKEKYDSLNQLMGTTGNAIKQRHNLGVKIMDDMAATMKFFYEELSPMTASFLNTYPQFYADFQSIKRIGIGNIHHSRLLAHCQTEVGESVYGITVTVDKFKDPETDKTYKSVSAVTDPNGDAEIIEFFAGNRIVTLSGPNIEKTIFPAIQFERGKAISHTFIVRPTFTNIPAPQETKEKAAK